MRVRFSRILALAAALSLFQGSLFAAPVEVPRVEAPVGSGISNAAPSAGAAVLAPTLFAPAAPAISGALPALHLAAAAPAIAAAPVAAAPSAAPALRSVAGAAPSIGDRPAGVFGRRQEPAREDAPSVSGEQAWTQSSALFDLSAVRAEGADVPEARAGLPANASGKVLVGLRRAGERGESGPGAIPGMARVEWAGPTGHGNSGETTNVLIGGKPWYLKRLGPSPDPVIAATPPETRARNEVGMAAVLRGDPLLSRSFSVAPRVSVFRDGANVYVLSEGLPSLGDGESRRQELSTEQRADAAIIQLVLGVGDMHGGDVLPLGGGRFGLVDFEKVSRAPLEKATPREIDEQVMMKNFPLVDRLSMNDPAVYRERFERWSRDYASGGRARMDKALAESGWSRPQRDVYLAAVERNAATYLERLAPYLDYANDWHQRIQKARAEAANREPEPKRGLFGGLFGPGKSDR